MKTQANKQEHLVLKDSSEKILEENQITSNAKARPRSASYHARGPVSSQLTALTMSAKTKQRTKFPLKQKSSKQANQRHTISSAKPYRPSSSKPILKSPGIQKSNRPSDDYEYTTSKRENLSIRNELQLHDKAIRAMCYDLSKLKQDLNRQNNFKRNPESQGRYRTIESQTHGRTPVKPVDTITRPSATTTRQRSPGKRTVDPQGIIRTELSPQQQEYWKWTFIHKPLKRYSLQQKPREVIDMFQLYNLFNQSFFWVGAPNVKIRATVFEGTNPNLTALLLQSRMGVEFNNRPGTSHVVWTECMEPESIARKIRGAMRFPLGSLPVAESQMIRTLDFTDTPHLIELLQATRLFKFDAKHAERCFTKLVEENKISGASGDNIRLMNHIFGLDYLTNDLQMTTNVTNFCQGRIPMFVPQTYQINRHSSNGEDDDDEEDGQVKEEGFMVNLGLLIYSIKQFGGGFKTPFILKPGEFADKDAPLSLISGEQDLIKKVATLFRSQKNKDMKNAILQAFIPNPLKYKGMRFDIRCYALFVKHFRQISVFWYNQGHSKDSAFNHGVDAKNNLKIKLKNHPKLADRDLTLYYHELEEFFQEEFGSSFLENVVPVLKVMMTNKVKSEGGDRFVPH